MWSLWDRLWETKNINQRDLLVDWLWEDQTGFGELNKN